MMSAGRGRRHGGAGGFVLWAAADVVLIAFFALLGHLSHYGTLSFVDIAKTALPFLIAYLAGNLLLRAWRSPTALLRTAVPLWLVTAGGGLVLRVVLGESAALSFQIVAVSVLALFLLGPRSIAAWMSTFSKNRRAPQQPAPHSPSHNQGAAT